MLHKCGPSCWKYASEDNPRVCRHQVHHFVDLIPEEGTDNKKKRIRREGRELVNVEYIIEEYAGGQRGRLKQLQEHPGETTTNYAGAVCMRCNLDNQTLCRFPATSIFDAGPFSTLGRRPLWGTMEQEIPPGATTSLVLPVDESVPIWSVSVMADEQKHQESVMSSPVLPMAKDVEMSISEDGGEYCRSKYKQLGEGSALKSTQEPDQGVESKGDALAVDDDEKIIEEITRETDLLFQDAHNAGYYINEYTTKVQALGHKLLQGLRKAAERRRDEKAAEEWAAPSKAVTSGGHLKEQKKDAAANFYKLVHLVNRLQVKSGAEMAFPILFGHMSFTTHRTWEMNMRYPTFLIWASWEKHHGRSLQEF